MTAPPSQTCIRCGEPITPGARFCMKCGNDISGQQGSVPTAMLPAAFERDAEDMQLETLKQATLGEFEILRELGRGGMATVYLAHDIALDRKVAIKVMSPALLLMGEGMTERFKREARTAASLSHPHIIPIYTVKSSGKSLFFVMKFIAGRSLESVMREVGPLPIPMVKALLQQVGSALGFAHRHGIVHRDVKPANIMMDEEGWSVVTDFGIAKVAENRGLTMTGIAVGTPSYMSPEQCAAKDITGKSDQYSLGVVAYEMLSGHQPFEGDSAMSIMFAHFHEQPKPVLENRPECPPELAAAVMRMLEKPPDTRWPSLEDMIGAIGAAPLAHDDPTHRQMQELARRNSNRELLNAVPLPPTSPVPHGRRSGAEKATTPIPTPRVITVSVAPGRSDLAVGESMQLTATARSTSGTAAGSRVKWASNDTAIATVSDTGLVTAIAVGTATITATSDDVTGTATVAVTPAPVAQVNVNPAMRSLPAGDSVRLEAAVRDARGVTLTDRTVAWASSHPAIATVAGDGTVTALAEGTAEVTATAEGIKGSARISVQRAPVGAVALKPGTLALTVGQSVTVEAAVTDPKGRKLTDRTVEWSSTAPGVVSVSAAGVVVGQAEGTAEILAAVEGVKASVVVKVAPVPVASVTIANPDPITVGGQVTLALTVKDGGGRPLTGRAAAWTSNSPRIATVSTTGVVAGVATGTAKVSAEVEGKSWTVSVTVTPVPVAEVVITGVPDRLEPGTRATLVATPRDAAGNPLKDRKVQWSSSDRNVAAVSSSGGLTVQSAGSAIISAESEGKQGRVALAIAAPEVPAPARPASPPVEQVALAEAATQIIVPPTLPPPAPAPHEPAKPAAAGGRGKLVGACVAIAILAGAGYFATHRGQAGTDGGTAPPPPPAAQPGPAGPPPPAPVAVVAISGPAGAVAPGRTLQLGAVVRDAAGAELANRGVSWTSSDPAVATVDGVGAVAAVKPGRAQITATSEGKTGSYDLVIEAPASGAAQVPAPAAVATVTVAAVSRPLDIGGTAQLAATVKDAKGKPLTDRTVVWSTSAPEVATVTSSGLAMAIGQGAATITAGSEGKSGTVKLTVNGPPPVASVALAPATLVLVEGQTGTLAATVIDEKRNQVERPVAWTSSDPDVARVTDGVVAAVAEGAATITAQAEGKSATARVTVKAAPPAVVPVAAIALTATDRSVKVGATITWTAQARDAKGNVLPDRPIGWTSADPKVATVAGGIITGVAAGKTEVRAEIDGKQKSEKITVEAAPAPPPPPPPPAAVTTSPGPAPGPVTGGAAASGLVLRRSVTSGGTQSCGIAAAGVICWGGGDGSPSPVAGIPEPSAVVAGRGHACALGGGGKAFCWGDNKAGQLGDGTTASRTSAAPVSGDLSFTQLSAGGQHTCGVADGKAYCWGDNSSGQLGDGSTSAKRKPTPVDIKERVTDVAAGAKHSCVVTATAKAYCWGDGFSGQLGIGALDQQTEPYGVAGSTKWTAITAGAEHTCGLAQGGKAFCWGRNTSGQVGDGSGSDRSVPAAVAGGVLFEEISAGANHTCGIDAGGGVSCWGDNKAGQLGDGTKTGRNKPVAVDGGPFRGVSAGARHTCAMSRNGEAVCWGDNDKGQLGDGSTTPRGTPGPVRAGP
jgi:uncharacterized protein YjdB/alpha-tubulin suppressor-like RCC1 family protein